MTPLERIAEGRGEYRGAVCYLHDSPDCRSCAYDLDEKINIRFHLPRAMGSHRLTLTLYCENLGDSPVTTEAIWSDTSCGIDIYDVSLDAGALPLGLYFLHCAVDTLAGRYYAHGGIGGLLLDMNDGKCDLPQLTIYHMEHTSPTSMLGGVIYHIFVDRFMRGGDTCSREGSRLIDGEWEYIPEYPEYAGAPLRNNTFYGGTLYGISDKLDYISSLGVNAIYLSPIFESVSNHRYDTADYMRVDSLLGGDEALGHLISEADKRGIRIILDGVFNHTGDDSIYFNRYGHYNSVGACQSEDSPFYPWYDFRRYPTAYTCWWDIDILPRINPDIPSCGEYFVGEDGVIAKYRRMGVYGFRLDVADELSDHFISRIKERLSDGGESVLYGEVWEDASNKIAYNTRKRYYLGSELDGVMNYPLRKGLIDYLTLRDTSTLRYALTDVTFNAPDIVMHTQMNLLGTHDTERILTVLGGAPDRGKPNSVLQKARLPLDNYDLGVRRLKSAYTILASLPGIPTIFYGDEAGLEGYSDPFNRMPYPWGKENEELLTHYRRLGEIRGTESAYRLGSFDLLLLTEDALVFSRCGKKYKYITVYNNSEQPLRLVFSARAQELLTNNSTTEAILHPTTAEIYRVRYDSEIQIIR